MRATKPGLRMLSKADTLPFADGARRHADSIERRDPRIERMKWVGGA